MPTISSRLSIAGMGLVLTLAVLPAPTFAATTTTGFCGRLSSDETAIQSGINNRLTTLAKDRTAHANTLAMDRNNFDNQVAAGRAKWDTDRQQNYAALQSKAKTATEQAAVQTFEETVNTDVTAHRAAVDAARDTFRAGEDQLIANRQAQVNAAVQTFQQAVAAAETTAASSCSDGTAAATVRATFVTAMAAARQDYVKTVTAIPAVAGPVAILAATRMAAVKAADATFTAEVEQAGTTLKAALGQTS